MKPKYPGIRITTNGNQLVAYHTEARITEGGIFYPITPSTEMGENYQLAYAEGKLNVFGDFKVAIECEGEHAAQGGAIAYSVTGRRTVNFTSGQGIVYGLEQYYHAPGKLSTMVLEVSARALTKHALNVHCGHDDIYAALDTGWTILFAKDAQEAADQAVIARRCAELTLNPVINAQDGFLTSHLERTFYKHEAELLREYLGSAEDMIDCPTAPQRELFGPKRRRVPRMVDLKHPALIGPVQNQEHYMNGVVARRNNFTRFVLPILDECYKLWGELTGRYYGMLSGYRCEDAETVFLTMGSAAENIEAAVDYLRDKGESVGSYHLNVLRPFPEAEIAYALRGKKNCIILERTDEGLSPENPIMKDVRAVLSKCSEAYMSGKKIGLPPISPEELPHLFGGVYGLGSRDFRPEGILGAYEYAVKGGARQDGRTAEKGINHFVIGIDHPYEVKSALAPSLLPDKAIAVRFHSIGGWGAITTGKNLGEILGSLGEYIAERDNLHDEDGRLKEVVHVSANPKYGSEKKGAPTNYFLVAAPDRIRVNCDLRHVNTVLCCDPKIFLHTDPLDGIADGGALVWESSESPETAWTRVPPEYRHEIIEKKVRVFILPGFDIARKATSRADLQTRMQGNAFLGAFFKVSTFLGNFKIPFEDFKEVVHKQYVKKFGRFGDEVVASNMDVMLGGFERCVEIQYGEMNAADRSKFRSKMVLPVGASGSEQVAITARSGIGVSPMEHGQDARATTGIERSRLPAAVADNCCSQPEKSNLFKMSYFDSEFRAGLGYHQPASPLSSVSLMAAGTGATASKYVARLETPMYHPENCTQCMECITACPDTALPNTAQDVMTVLSTAANRYVSSQADRDKLIGHLPMVEEKVRKMMNENIAKKGETNPRFSQLVHSVVKELGDVAQEAKDEFSGIIDILPLAYGKANAVYSNIEKKNPGEGGLFAIFVSDLCKGCAECVTECGEHEALSMVQETEEVNAEHLSAMRFFDLLPDTPRKYLGLYDNDNPAESRAAALRNHLMVRSNYEALVSGDGSCAGCGEKSVIHGAVSVTEAYMRALYVKKSARLREKADRVEKEGVARLAKAKAANAEAYGVLKTAIAHLIFDQGGEDDKDTATRIARYELETGELTDERMIEALVLVLRHDAFNHDSLQSLEGRLDNGMSVMAMGANTGCNTVYGSTPPNNPHPYPWMNSLFQDGSTITWMFGESFIFDHGRRSVIPERFADIVIEREGDIFSKPEYFDFAHLNDNHMTDLEIRELPKAWAVGGDGGMGDIGFQNLSKVVLQNRPNVLSLLLDTQVYSNTGGQNSDSSVMTGGFDMNQYGAASQGKLTEKKGVAEIFTSGHGSPFVAQISMANSVKFYKAILDGLEYRGTAFFQAFTTCQPEHGVADDVSTIQAQRIRDSRGMPEFVFNPAGGETYEESFDLKGNPSPKTDWYQAAFQDKTKYAYTVAHWAVTEARFRQHVKKIKEPETAGMIHLDDAILRVLQRDVIDRKFLDPEHRAYIPDWKVYMEAEDSQGKRGYYKMSRQMVLFCIERRKAWRLLQSKSGIVNAEYKAQRSLLEKFDKGEIAREDFFSRTKELFDAEVAAMKA
ncbi:MAG: 2-oxoacid:acceptor oxidoreductase family protein [Planctomycetes bacterium]|nr:2-oxoacid:acceptor oxidoreductase family protein [Planctomycetota bacterium]